MTIKRLLLAAVLTAPALSYATTPLWLRDVQISPDGKTIAFCYKGDIWTVPVTGGSATRLTATDDYEQVPIWSPDGKQIAFAADRHGNNDIFIMDAKGGKTKRLTTNSAAELPEGFSADGKEIYYSASIQAPATSAMFPSGRMTQLYAVKTDGSSSARQVLGTPAKRLSNTANGFVYEDVKGFEDEWRKHHTSSVTRDLWSYDAKNGKHTNLTERPGEDRNPVVAGNDLYFLSERNGGTMNVYKSSLANPKEAVAVTSFKEHPVRFLSRGADGTLCFTWDGEIYTMTQGAKPQKVVIDVVETDDAVPQKLSTTSGASEVAVSPDGKQVALVWRGDVFVTTAEYKTTKQISSTPEAEADVTWSADGKTLYYTSERDGRRNIYKATMAREDEPNFANATIINEEKVFGTDKHERSHPQVSPDGKKLAFILDRNRLQVANIDGSKVKELTDGSTWPGREGGFRYSWSPDSKWIALDIQARKHDPYSDVAIINVDNGTLTNISNTGYFDSDARWVNGGNAIMFVTDRYGMRNHASWGSQYDVMLVFLNQDAYDKYRLSEEDYALRKELDKKSTKKDDKKDDKKDAKKDDKKDEKADKAINVELDGITDRIVRLTPMSTALRDAIMTDDGETLYYIARAQNGSQLWKYTPRKDEHKMLGKEDGGSFLSDKDGKTFFVIGRTLKKLDPKSDKLTPITYSLNKTLNAAAEREFMFDNMVREEGERFYNKNMHGVDWPRMTKAYRKFLPHINNNYDYAEMLSELLGELNVSHTGGRYSGKYNANADRTASLGLLYDMTYTGNGLKVAEVIEKGPFDNASSKITPGVIIEKINGVEIKADTDHDALLTDLSGKKTLVSIYNPTTKERFDEVILPITASAQSSLLYDRWVKQRAADVDRWSNGRLGYVHIPSMADPAFRTMYADVLGKYNDREGIVIDIRWNGGGRMHEDIEVLFSGQKYLTQEIRGVDVCDMPSRRWNKPSIMVTAEACYSNAHGTPWVYQHQGIGKIVGAPVAGTMTSVNWVTMQDPSLVYGIPVIGYRTAEGNYLENTQLQPDIEVYNAPETIVTGEDTQLRTAVQTLLKDLDTKKK